MRSVPAAAEPGPPGTSLVFVLLDTTRADRLGAWGGPNPTSPTLDALAGAGVRFDRHFANAHATRPSMPQLMTGRYYHQSVLKPFRPDDHPREFPFSRDDPTAALLPALLATAGFETLAVSAHPWVSQDSPFGAAFTRFELLPAPSAERPHASAPAVIERALRAWRGRDRGRRTFLYVHLMDAHMPRFLPEGGLRFPIPPGYDTARFRPDGEPAFDRGRRGWSRFDARDFTPDDRRYFAAVYDTLLAQQDEHLAPLFAALGADDPELQRTLVVVTADHGEELGDEGRIDHGDSLADAVQHVPLVIAGGGVVPGQVVSRFTEHVDVLPTILSRLGIAAPPGVRMDGRPQLDGQGRACRGCGKPAVFYAWEDYRGIRRRRTLLRHNVPGSVRARCEGTDPTFSVAEDGARIPLVDRAATRALRRALDARLGPLERAFRDTRYGPADRPVILRSEFWRLDTDGPLHCVTIDGETRRPALGQAGWLATARGLAVLEPGGGARPVAAALELPDGRYRVELLTSPAEAPPAVFGFGAWLKRTFARDRPREPLAIGARDASGGRLDVAIDPAAVAGRRVFAIQATPDGLATSPAPAPPDDEQLRRLRALGYVE